MGEFTEFVICMPSHPTVKWAHSGSVGDAKCLALVWRSLHMCGYQRHITAFHLTLSFLFGCCVFVR